jgi:hypothetical protein
MRTKPRSARGKAWPFNCPPPPDLTCYLPIGWLVSQLGPAVLARGVEKWAFLRQALDPVKSPVDLGGTTGSVMRYLGNQEDDRKKHPHGCHICKKDCEFTFVPGTSSGRPT